MRTFISALAVLMLPLLAQADGTGTVTFYVLCGTKGMDSQIEAQDGTTVRLTAKKGTKVLDDTFTFPKGSTAATAVDHYAAALAAAGFVEGTDFVKAGNSIKFKNPDHIDGGTQNRCQYSVTYRVSGGVGVGSAPVTGAEVKIGKNAPAGGSFIITGLGLAPLPGGGYQARSAHAQVEVHPTDTDVETMERVAGRLVSLGWSAEYSSSAGVIRITTLPDGTQLTALTCAFLDDGQFAAGGICSETEPVRPEALHWRCAIVRD